MRKSILAIFILATTSLNVFALPDDPNSHPGMFELSFTGGGFKNGTENTDYGIFPATFSDLGAMNVPGGNILKNNPKYKFAGGVLLKYFYPDSTYNIDCTYFGARNELADSDSGEIASTILPARFFQGGPDGTASFIWAFSDSSYDFDYDFVNVEIGSLTQFDNQSLYLNPQLGVTYARLKDNQAIEYNHFIGDTGLTIPDSFEMSRGSDFKGVGPSIGISANYFLCECLSLIGNFRYNALVGNINSHNIVNSSDVTVFSNMSLKTKLALVNLIQAEISIAYDFNLADFSDRMGLINCGNIAVGYQTTKSFGNAEHMLFLDENNSTQLTDSILDSSIQGYFARFTIYFGI